ncbi:MAG: DUF2752 domain-containing protein [Planctomycetaceae bacterium]
MAKSSRYHFAILLLSIAIIGLAFALETRPDGRVFFRTNPDRVLPHTCASKVLFNMDCAGCGLTRSFIHLAAFRPEEAFRIHRAGPIVALVVLLQIPFRMLQIGRLRRGQPPYQAEWLWWVVGIVIALLFIHWFLARFGI